MNINSKSYFQYKFVNVVFSIKYMYSSAKYYHPIVYSAHFNQSRSNLGVGQRQQL
jgi:hypothetical protein